MEEALIEHSAAGETVTLPYDLEGPSGGGTGGCNGHRPAAAGTAGTESAAARETDGPAHSGDGETTDVNTGRTGQVKH